MENNIKVSIVIPVYKTEKFLEITVNSVLNQTYKNIEIILVDDGSPDNSPVICDKLTNKYENIIVVHKENGGLSSARNAGIEKATGKYILFLDSDDTLVDCTIEDMVEIIEKDNSDAVFPNSYYKVYENSSEKEIAYHFTEDMFETDPIKYVVNVLCGKARGQRSTAVLYRTETIVNHGVRFPLGLISEDFFYMLDFMAVAKKLSIYTKPSLLNLKREGSITSEFHPGFEKTIWLMDEKSIEFLEKMGAKNEASMKKVDDLLCRNVITYVFRIMSSRNPLPYEEKAQIAKDLLKHEKTRYVWKGSHPTPYFHRVKTKLAFAVIYKLLGFNFINLALRIMSFS